MSFLDYGSFLNEGKKSSSGIDFESVPDVYKQAAEKARKTEQLEKFWKLLPEGEGKQALFDLLNQLSSNAGAVNEFISKLWSKKGPTGAEGAIDISPNDYAGGVGQKLFALKPAGLGRGELFLSWIVAESETQGGNVNFDLMVPAGKFEVKDYRPYGNAAIRLGVKGKAPRFTFMQQIYDTMSLLKKMIGDGTKYNFEESIGDKDFVEHVNYITENSARIYTGEFNRGDLTQFTAFYEKVSTIEFTPDVYVKAILRGPGGEPLEINIEPISIEDAQKNNEITIKKSGAISTSDSVLAELRRLKYTRNPKDLEADMQSAVNEIVGDIPFIVFRKDGINVTKAFKFYSVSQSGVVILEKSIADKVKDDEVNVNAAIDADAI